MLINDLTTHTCNIYTGAAGPWTNIAGPIISEVWFPINERVTATSIGIFGNFGGFALAFVFGPLIVRKSFPSIVVFYVFLLILNLTT